MITRARILQHFLRKSHMYCCINFQIFWTKTLITLHDPLERNLGIKLFNQENESQPENSENEKDLEMLENEYIPISEPEPTSDVVHSSDDSDSSDDEEDVLPLRSGKKRVTFS